jgi:predicted nuclease of predicted toxin-antitoxin system
MMRLLLDQNMPPQAKDWLKDVEVDCLHVRDASLKTATDYRLLNFATLDQRYILTKDSDFIALAKENSSDNVVIIVLRDGNLRNRDFEPWLVNRWPLVCEMIEKGETLIELN